MAKVTLLRNIGHADAGTLDLKPSEAREGRQVDVEDDVRDELILQGLAREQDEGENGGGLDLNDPDIRKKLEEKELEFALAAGLDQFRQDRQQESLGRMSEVEGELIRERDRIRQEKREEGERIMQELRDEPPKGPEEQPRLIFGGSFLSGSGSGDRGKGKTRDKDKERTMSRGNEPDVEVEEDVEQEEKRRREQERRGQPQPPPTTPRPAGPTPAQPAPPTPPPGRQGGGTPRKQS